MTLAKLEQFKAGVVAAEAFFADIEEKRADALHYVTEVDAERKKLPLDEAAIKRHLGAEDAAKLRLEVADRMVEQARDSLAAAKAAVTKAEWQHERDRVALRVDEVVDRLRTKYRHHATEIVKILVAAQVVENEHISLCYLTRRLEITEKIPPSPLAVVGMRYFEENHLDGLDGKQLWPVSEKDLSDAVLDLPDL